ncbi:MAG: hypothetical protein V4787_27255 [Pseudomonadota bacterium]
MYVVTLGMYEFYWFYRQWIAVRDFNRIYISPAARTVASLVFAFNLFKRILDTSRLTPAASFGLAIVLGAILIAAAVAAYFPPPYVFIALLGPIPVIPMQVLANRANTRVDPTHTVNAKLSRLNWVAVVLGGALLLLGVAGAILS